MQDFSKYGKNHASLQHLPPISAARSGELVNISKEAMGGGLAQLNNINGFPESCNMLLNGDIYPLDLDVPDFAEEWMEEYVPLDSLLTLQDVSLQMALNAPTLPHDNNPSYPTIKVEQDNEQNQIADTIQQLLQLQAMADPDSVYTPPVSPQSFSPPPSSPQSFSPAPSFPQSVNSSSQYIYNFPSQNIYNIPSPQNIYNIPSPQNIYNTPSPLNIFNTSSPQNIYTPPASPLNIYILPKSPENDLFIPAISRENIFIFPKAGQDFNTSSLSQENVNSSPKSGDMMYTSPITSYQYQSSPSSDQYSNHESSPAYFYSPEPYSPSSCFVPQQAPVQRDKVPFDDDFSDFSSGSSSQMSDSSSECSSSSYESLDTAVTSMKRCGDSPSGTNSQPKRSRKVNPNRQPEQIIKIKKERKKVQNKTAATRYRIKKRSEADILSTEESELMQKNKELKSNVDKLTTEMGYLKGLLKEVLAVKGVLKC